MLQILSEIMYIKFSVDVRGMVVWEVPLVFPLEVTTIWTAIIQQRIPCSTHKHVWEILTLKHLKVGEWKHDGKEGGEKIENRCHGCSPELTVGLRRREESGCRPCSLSPEKQRGTVSVPARVVLYLLRLSPVNGVEMEHRGTTMVVWWLPLPSRKTKSWNEDIPPLTLPELVPGPRRCSSECRATEHIICNSWELGWQKHFFAEQQGHPVLYPNDKGRERYTGEAAEVWRHY